VESLSKIRIEPAVLAGICRRYLGADLASSRELTDGWFNTIHRLDAADGRRAVLKASPPPGFTVMRYERGLIDCETETLRLLADAGLKAPRVLAASSGGDGIPHPWFLMDYLEGDSLAKRRASLAPAEGDRIDAEVAAQAARVNALAGPRFGRWLEDGTAAARWSDSLLAMVDDVLADARDRAVELPASAAAVRAAYAAAKPELDEVAVPRLVLWDLHDGNVVVGGEPVGLAGFLDTDRALWGDPLMEFYFRGLAKASGAWRTAYRAACAASGLADPADRPGAGRCLALYDLYLALVMLVETAFRGYGPDHIAWTRGHCAQAWAAVAERVQRSMAPRS
jgi:aminoglycoside phosphotransferase (APT) family kinase protein